MGGFSSTIDAGVYCCYFRDIERFFGGIAVSIAPIISVPIFARALGVSMKELMLIAIMHSLLIGGVGFQVGEALKGSVLDSCRSILGRFGSRGDD